MKKKKYMKMKISTLIIFIAILPFVIGRDCGYPGRPGNGSAKSVEKFFYPSEEVEYECDEGFVIFGDRRRTCKENGMWSGGLPECKYNMALGKTTSQSDTLWSYNSNLAVDGDGNTCSFTPQSDVQRWWQVHLEGSPHVGSVAITMSPGSYQHFTIFIVELLEGNKAMYKPCAKFDGRFQDQKVLFKCNEDEGHSGQFVYIRDDREDKEYFGLCEVEVFEHKGRPHCGDPEQPIYGLVKTSKQSAHYSCIPGYILNGNTTRICTWSGWEGQVPKCVEVQCDHPSSTKDGFIEVSNFKGSYVYGSRATYHCNPGFILWGNATRLCDSRGIWTGETPQCQPIACGDPITFPHASVAMLNGSTVWKAVAQYACIHGYKLLSGNGSSELHVLESVCLQNGSWTRVHLTCVKNPSYADPRYDSSFGSSRDERNPSSTATTTTTRIGFYGGGGGFGAGGTLTMISVVAAVIFGTGAAALIILIRGWLRRISGSPRHRHMIIGGDSGGSGGSGGACFDGRHHETHKYSDLANNTVTAIANQYGTLTLIHDGKNGEEEPCYETTNLSTFRASPEAATYSTDEENDEDEKDSKNPSNTRNKRKRKRRRRAHSEDQLFLPPTPYLEARRPQLVPLSEEEPILAARIPSPPRYVNLRSLSREIPSYATLNRRPSDAVPDILCVSKREEEASQRQTRTLPHHRGNARERLSAYFDSPPCSEKRVIINELSTFLETPLELLPEYSKKH